MERTLIPFVQVRQQTITETLIVWAVDYDSAHSMMSPTYEKPLSTHRTDTQVVSTTSCVMFDNMPEVTEKYQR